MPRAKKSTKEVNVAPDLIEDKINTVAETPEEFVVYPEVKLDSEDVKYLIDSLAADDISEVENVEDGIDVVVPDAPVELTEEEKHEQFIKALKASKIKYHPVRNFVKKVVKTISIVQPFGGSYHKTKVERFETIQTNVTTNQFGSDYKKKRNKKNKMAKKSRAANR
jgi:hypothetical protein